MLKTTRALRVAGAIIFLLGSLSGTAWAADGTSIAAGARTWADNCDRCHNMRDPQDFDAGQWRVIVTHMRVRAGLTGSEARDVLEFLQQSGGPARTAGGSTNSNISTASASATSGAPDGKRIYEGTCIACHGPDGKGTVPGAPDLTAGAGPLSKSDSVLFDSIKNGFQTPSSPLAMPPKGGDQSLTDADVQAVLRYLHNAFGP